jgi:1,4-dihydroxy-6-naphthoate synthase
MSQYTLLFSPCPNDCYVFDALVHERIALNGLKFNYVLEDVETLNKMASQGHPDIIKLSFNAYTRLSHKYQLLDAGSALGRNCGPLILSREEMKLHDLKDKVIAIPGVNTTANFLLDFAVPSVKGKVEMLFSDIEDAVLSGKVDAGLVIHESRFTYEEKGLLKVADLGELWESKTKMPIPLGGIFINRNLDEETKNTINRLLKESVLFAMRNPAASMNFVKENAAEMDESVMRKHIKTYVNNYSVDLGDEGRAAVRFLLERSGEQITEPIFLPQ